MKTLIITSTIVIASIASVTAININNTKIANKAIKLANEAIENQKIEAAQVKLRVAQAAENHRVTCQALYATGDAALSKYESISRQMKNRSQAELVSLAPQLIPEIEEIQQKLIGIQQKAIDMDCVAY